MCLKQKSCVTVYLKFKTGSYGTELKVEAQRRILCQREKISYGIVKDLNQHIIYSNIPKKTGGLGKKNGQENRALTNVWYDLSPIVPWSKERNGHPTQKPVQLMERCVSIWTNEGDTILDFTAGSGSTGVAALNLGRKFIGIEKDPEWYQVALSRLQEAGDIAC